MISWRNEYQTLISPSQTTDTFYWISLLNFFEKYKDELSLNELNELVDKCDKCMISFNKNTTDPIHRKDIRPDIYSYIENRITIKNNNKNNFSESYCAIPA